MKFKDFIYYVLLVIVAGLFLVLSFSYFGGKDKESGVDRVSVDLAYGKIHSQYSFGYDIPSDFVSYDFIEFYYYSDDVTGFGKIDVRDYIAAGYDDFIKGSLITYDSPGTLVFFSFSCDLTGRLLVSLSGLGLDLTPIYIEGYFYLKGVNYV